MARVAPERAHTRDMPAPAAGTDGSASRTWRWPGGEGGEPLAGWAGPRLRLAGNQALAYLRNHGGGPWALPVPRDPDA